MRSSRRTPSSTRRRRCGERGNDRGRLARRRRRGAGPALRPGVAPVAHPLAPAARRPAPPAPARHGAAGRDHRAVQRRRAGHPVPRRGRHRRRHPADAARRRARDAARHRRRGRRGRAGPGAHPAGVPAAVRPHRPGHPARTPPPRLRPLPAAVPVVPREVHLRAGDLAAHLGRRGDRRAAGVRPGRAGHGGAHVGRHRGHAARARRAPRRGRAAAAAPAAAVHPLVPARVQRHLPQDQGDRRPGHRPLRRVDDRHPRGPGVPQGVAQPGDLRAAQPGLPRRQHARHAPHRRLHARRQADRQRDRGRGPAVRRVARAARRGHGRRAGRVPALPAPVLRAHAGDQPVLQHAPVGERGAGEAVRGAGGGARRRRVPPPRGPAVREGGGAVRGGRVRLPGRASGHPGARSGAPGRADRGGRRHHGCGQDHAGQADLPVLRPGVRPRPPRRGGSA